MSSPLSEAWVDFLGRNEWQWFATFTYDPAKKHPDSQRAWRDFRKFVHKLNCTVFGRQWRRRQQGCWFIVVQEKHFSGALHLHALIGASVPLDTATWPVNWQRYWKQSHGRAEIEVIRDQAAVARYVTKTAHCGNEIELSENLKRVE